MMKAWFVNCLDKTFVRIFDSYEDFEEFMKRADEVGTKLLGYVSI